MAKKLSTEERQLEKLTAGDTDSSAGYIQKKTEKDKIVDKIVKEKGFNVVYDSGVPVFSVVSQEDVDYIRKQIEGKGSYGFRCPKEAKIKMFGK